MEALIPLWHTEGWIKYLSIPVFTGVIGWVTNWTGVLMLFYPIRYRGVRIPGLKTLSHLLPRRILEVPLGLDRGRFGWQGIIPSRAAKMGSIAIDKGLTKLGTQSEFYEQLDPNAISEHLLATSRDEVHEMVDRIMRRHYPAVWANLPDPLRQAIHSRVEARLPAIVSEVTNGIGANIDQLLDVKLMVIGYMEDDPTLANTIFQEIGRRELRLIIHFGLVFGFLLGIPLLFLTIAYPVWWLVPLCGAIIGYVTNWLAITMIFEPAEPIRIGPVKLQGLFIRRQDGAADVWAGIVADRIITLQNIGRELFEGPRSDRTRRMIETHLRPSVDHAVGLARRPVRVAIGDEAYDAIAQSVAAEATTLTGQKLLDEEFNRRQSANIRRLIADRTRKLSAPDFAEMLRSAIKEDEWLLILHGAVLGIVAGLAHVVIFGA
jgi:uncharacterized membrane protein YheB (UPF0754 family)